MTGTFNGATRCSWFSSFEQLKRPQVVIDDEFSNVLVVVSRSGNDSRGTQIGVRDGLNSSY